MATKNGSFLILLGNIEGEKIPGVYIHCARLNNNTESYEIF